MYDFLETYLFAELCITLLHLSLDIYIQQKTVVILSSSLFIVFLRQILCLSSLDSHQPKKERLGNDLKAWQCRAKSVKK